MFDATSRDGAPLSISLPFWQCVKAGVGFTLGAAAVSALGVVLWLTVFLPFWVRAVANSLYR